MIRYERHILDNGLTLLLHCDRETPMVTVNTLYGVGSRDENPERTGMAHLLEHLMFGGTKRYPDYDSVVQTMGGESNAYTNNDYTNYYVTVPAGYVEQAIDLEMDRMVNGLDWSEERLAVQKKVVTEEYNQRYMNQPYGDMWLLLRPLSFKRSLYRWCTIGADIRHVAEATLEEVRGFCKRWYRPDNAIMAVAGNIDCERVRDLISNYAIGSDAWHGQDLQISKCSAGRRNYEREPEQTEERRMEVRREVPSDALYMAYNMCGRTEGDFVVCDVISDLLSNGKSSRLYRKLVVERRLFSEVNAYVTGDRGEGLFVVSGKMNEGVALEEGEAAVRQELTLLGDEAVSDTELEKVVSKYESTFEYSQYKASDRAAALCCYEWMGHLDWVNNEPELYHRVTTEDVRRVAAGLFRPERCNVLWMRCVPAQGE
ncbi:MAG: insulinase family protein [Bacteroidales bacterium]|nr:insulinase family protein [Bacteroidales bacterium]